MKWGTQTQTTWRASEVDERPILDASTPAEQLWRVSVAGSNVLLSMSYGTCGTIDLSRIRLPFVAYVPGSLSLQGVPLVPGVAARAIPTLVQVSSAGADALITTIETGALDARVHRVTAITAATVTVDANAIVLAAGESVNVVEPSVVTAGSVLADWTL